MKTISLATLVLLITTTAFAQGASPYDYWVAIAQIPATSTATTVTQNIVVFVGNHGPFGGPYYDVSMTVKTGDGQKVICSTSLATQPPLQNGQQLNVLEFQLTYPKGQWKLASRKSTQQKVLVFANIRTDYPNADTNPSNGSASKEFSFPVIRVGAMPAIYGTPTCKTLQ